MSSQSAFSQQLISLVLILLALLFFMIQVVLFLNYPVIWSDEAIYTDLALNFIQDGVFKTSLWQGLLKGVEEIALWYPPLFLLLIAFWLKIVPVSAVSLRFLPLFLSILFLLLSWMWIRRYLLLKPWFSLGYLLLLIIDTTFIQASRLARPEILVLVLVILLFIFLSQIKFFKDKSKNQSLFWFLIGLLSSAIVLTHYYAVLLAPVFVSYYLVEHYPFLKKTPVVHLIKDNFLRILKTIIWFSLGFFIPLVCWFITISPHLELLQLHLSLSAELKAFETPWVINVFKGRDLLLKAIYLNYLTLIIIIIWQSITTKNRYLFWLAFSVIWLLIVTTYGKMLWYFVYLVPFIYLGLMYSWQLLVSLDWKRKALTSLLLLTLVLHGWKIGERIILITQEQLSYDRYSVQVLAHVPDNTTVFLSALPDPYLAFIKAGRNNQLIEFPTMRVSESIYEEILNQADYAIYNGDHHPQFGNFLFNYLQEHAVEIIPVSYGVVIVKLK